MTAPGLPPTPSGAYAPCGVCHKSVFVVRTGNLRTHVARTNPGEDVPEYRVCAGSRTPAGSSS